MLIGDNIEPGYNPQPQHIPDHMYSQMLDSIVVACLDMALTNDTGKMLIGKRAWHPQADWWVIGGRLRTGESLETAANRLFTCETGLDPIEPHRYKYLTTMSNAWRMRRQPPAENGVHTLSVVLTACLTHDEAMKVKLNEEYTSQQWITVADVLAGQFHPGLRQCAYALGN